MHTFLLVLKYRPHLEAEWLFTTTILGVLAAITLDWTIVAVTLIGAIVSVTGIYYAYLTAKINKQVVETGVEVKELKVNSNSILDEVKRLSFVEGRKVGEEEEKKRQALEDLIKREQPKIDKPEALK